MESMTADRERTRGFIQSLYEAETIYLRLLGLTRDQSAALRDGVSPQLLDIARAKEVELERLDGLEGRLGPARREWPELRSRVDDGLRGEVQGALGRLEGVLREILELEACDGRRLAAEREQTLAEIRRVDSARKIRGAYGSPSAPARLLDQTE